MALHEYRGILGKIGIVSAPDWFQQHVFGYDERKMRHAAIQETLAVPAQRTVMEETCKKVMRAFNSVIPHDPEMVALTVGEDDVFFLRFEVARVRDWLRTLDAELAARELWIERAKMPPAPEGRRMRTRMAQDA